MPYFSARGRRTASSRWQMATDMTVLGWNALINSLENSACPTKYMPSLPALVE